MNAISEFKDLCTEIEIYKERVKDLEMEYYAIQRLHKYGKMPFIEYVRKTEEIWNTVAILTQVVKNKERSQQLIEQFIGNLEGLDYKIAHKRLIEGKTLKEISEELNYAYGWIRKKNMNLTKEQRGNSKVD
ncbi:MAG: hypothetical protein JM58_09520 [Peptococcaceae bacterium BICA1-8]|nr:MAG: hypothetical protein JM58_09520 [Peptococcaceae bacterium BICA1-8]